jgi:hypothetical protein
MGKVFMKFPQNIPETVEDATFTDKTRVAATTILTGILAASSVVSAGVSVYEAFF